MLKDYYYNICMQNIGSAVVITTHDNEMMKGVIKNVDSDNVYLMPLHEREGRFFPVLAAGLVGLGLGSIASLALYPPYPYPYYPYGYGYY